MGGRAPCTFLTPRPTVHPYDSPVPLRALHVVVDSQPKLLRDFSQLENIVCPPAVKVVQRIWLINRSISVFHCLVLDLQMTPLTGRSKQVFSTDRLKQNFPVVTCQNHQRRGFCFSGIISTKFALLSKLLTDKTDACHIFLF